MKPETRMAMEVDIRNRCVDTLLAAGFYLTVDDGESRPIRRSRDAQAIKDALGAVDEEWLYALARDGEKYRTFGGVFFVYGNDGYDVICDYHCCLEEVLKPVTEYADEMAEKYS